MSDEKKVTETTTKNNDDAFGNSPKETVKTETKAKENIFGDRKETTKIERKVEN